MPPRCCPAARERLLALRHYDVNAAQYLAISDAA